MFLASAPVVTLRCPGEMYDISPAVHRARLAAGYAKCRHCPHHPSAVQPGAAQTGTAQPGTIHPGAATDPEHLPGTLPVLDRNDGATDRGSRSPAVAALFQTEGVRGVYLNQLDRHLAGELAAAFAQELSRDLPEAGAASETSGPEVAAEGDSDGVEGVRVLQVGVPGPVVVLAHDDRPSGPDLARGVCLALRRMGFQVVDLGVATRAEFGFAIPQVRAVGGVLVTGAGGGPEQAGLEFAGLGGQPWSRPGRLSAVLAAWEGGVTRLARRSGGLRSYRVREDYVAPHRESCHALRPLRMVWSCSSRLVTRTLRHLLQSTACQLFEVDAAQRQRDLTDRADRDFAAVADRIGKERAHLGLVVGEEGQQVRLLDERGILIPTEHHAIWLQQEANRAGKPEGVPSFPTREGAWGALQAAKSSQAEGPAGCHWFVEPSPGPGCDAIATVLRTLQALSQSDASLSESLERVLPSANRG